MIHYSKSSGLAIASIQTAYKATRAMTPLSESSIVSATSQQVSCDLADGTLILQLQTGHYFRLNQVGTATWEFMQESHTVREVYLEILARYEVDSQRWERDLCGLLEEMREAELIEIKQ
jgi:Coenzyme PQQ synthesis protein D (PqqD)